MKIRTKTIISITGAFLLLSFGLGITYYFVTAKRLRLEAEKNLSLMSQSYATQIDLTLNNYSRVVRDYAAQVMVTTYIPDLFKESKRVYPEFDHFFYTSLKGRVAEIYPYGQKWLNVDFSSLSFWKDARKKQELVLQVDYNTFGKPVLVFSLPIVSYFLAESEPNTHGILIATLPLESLMEQYGQISMGSTGSLIVLDNMMNILSHSLSPESEGMSFDEWGGEGVLDIIPWLKGGYLGTADFSRGKSRYFTSFYPVKTTGWSLLLVQSVNELTLNMRNVVILIFTSFLVSIGLASLITTYLMSRITRPLNDNLQVLKDIAEGHGEFSGMKKISSHDEFEELSDYFGKIFARMDEVAQNLNVDLQKERWEKNITMNALEDTQRRFKAIFDNTFQLMFLINPGGLIIEVNQSLLSFRGEKRDNLVNTPFWDADWWASEDDKKMVRQFVTQSLEGRFSRHEFLFRGKNGSHTFDFTFKPILNDDGAAAMLIAEGRDITVRKVMEKELEAHRNRLKEMVEEKTAELKDAQEELIKQSKLATLGKLTAVVSHEIRNPLATIRSSSFVLKRKIRKEDEKIHNVLQRIERNVIRCDTIIEDLLSYTRETRLDVKNINIDEWLLTFKEYFDSNDQGVDVKLQLGSGAVSPLDTERFRRVIINLVSNAVQAIDQKDSGKDENPEVVIRTEKIGNNALIHIKDNGSGISEENSTKIFEPLFSTKSFGIGLGLPIVKQLIEKHDGVLSFKSEVGIGTTFTISLPVVE
jgi:PAS domain S-box-containing protein